MNPKHPSRVLVRVFLVPTLALALTVALAPLAAQQRFVHKPELPCKLTPRHILDEVVIKFRQGFGRLIRSQTDQGIVVVLDPRIHSKGYGKAFLRALPDCEVVEEHLIEEGVDEA